MRQVPSRLALLWVLFAGYAPLASAQTDGLTPARELLKAQAASEDPRVRAAYMGI